MRKNNNIIKIISVFLIICCSVSAFAEKQQNNLKETTDNSQKADKENIKNNYKKEKNKKRQKHKQKKYGIGFEYENYYAEDNFKQDIFKTKANMYMGTLANVRYDSKIKYKNYQTETANDHYFNEELHSLQYNLKAQHIDFFFNSDISYKSDKLFDTYKDTNAEINFAYKTWNKGHHLLYLGLLVTTDKLPINTPVFPLFAYMYYSQNLKIVISYESEIKWQIASYLEYNLFVSFEDLGIGNTSLTLRPTSSLAISALAESKKDKFKIADRKNTDESLVKVGYNCGLKISYNFDYITLWGYSGYTFSNQYYYIDESDDSKRMEKNIDNSWLFKLGANAKF